jgi:hypothetical protein
VIGRVGAVVVAAVLMAAPHASAQEFPVVDQPGVTDDEIRVGGVASVSGNVGGFGSDAPFEGVEAYFDYVNSTGEKGVCGRKLRLASKRDDALVNNRQEVQGLLDDGVFAALPIATGLFSGAELLADEGIPTFGWLINGEWGSEDLNPGPPNLFGQVGSFLNLNTPGPSYYVDAWLAQKLDRKRVGLISYSVAQSAGAAGAIEATFERFPRTGKVVFKDTSIGFGTLDFATQVAGMIGDDVNLVMPLMDLNGALALAREMRRQGMDAPLVLPYAYNQELVEEYADVIDGSYLYTTFTPFEAPVKPPGLKRYEKWMKRSGAKRSELSLVGWLNADLFVTGLRAAGCDFTREKVIDAINQMTAYDADGIIPAVDWTKAHREAPGCFAWLKIVDGSFEPVFGKPGKPFICFPADLTSIPRNPTPVG